MHVRSGLERGGINWGGIRHMHGRSGLEGGANTGWNPVYACEVVAGGGSYLGWSILVYPGLCMGGGGSVKGSN
jgi:hypothetical protein